MATLALTGVVVLGIVVFVLFGTVLELHKDIRQMRKVIGVLDTPLDIEIGAALGARPSNFGLPSALDNTAAGLVLFLSETCSTCRIIAASMSDSVPDNTFLVLEARDSQSAAAFRNQYFEGIPLADRDRVIVDANGEIASAIGLNTTPVGFRVRDGSFTEATTIPSVRYLASIAPGTTEDTIVATRRWESKNGWEINEQPIESAKMG